MQVLVVRSPRPNVEQAIDFEPGRRVLDLLRQLQVAPDAVVVLRGDAPLAVDAEVRDGDRLRIVNVFSGG